MLNASIVKRDNLAAEDRARMLTLHREVFENVDESQFAVDLAAKDWVILLREGDGAIAGFSAIELIDLDIDGCRRRFLFSGDTVVDRRHWHNSKLAGAFGHVMLKLLHNRAAPPAYWFLISKGYRTFRFLPVFFRVFHPTHDGHTPPELPRLLDAVAVHKFPNEYNAQTGVIERGGHKDRLRTEYQNVPDRTQRDPYVALFLDRNPGYIQGDELACLAPIREENLKRPARRVIERTKVNWDAAIR